MTVEIKGTGARAGSAQPKLLKAGAEALVESIYAKTMSMAEKLQRLEAERSTYTLTPAATKVFDTARSFLQAAASAESSASSQPPPTSEQPKAPGPHRISADDFHAVSGVALKALSDADAQLRPVLHGTFNSVLTALDEGERPPLDILAGTVTEFLEHPSHFASFRAAMPVLGELGRLSLPDPRVSAQLMGIAEKHGGEDGKQLMGSALEGIHSRRGFMDTVTKVALIAAKIAAPFAEGAAKATPYAGVAMVARQAIDFLDADGVERIGSAVRRLVDVVKQSPNKVDIAVGSANLVASIVGTVPRFHWVQPQAERFVDMYDTARGGSTQENWDEL